jgi:hypothetical protein
VGIGTMRFWKCEDWVFLLVALCLGLVRASWKWSGSEERVGNGIEFLAVQKSCKSRCKVTAVCTLFVLSANLLNKERFSYKSKTSL